MNFYFGNIVQNYNNILNPEPFFGKKTHFFINLYTKSVP